MPACSEILDTVLQGHMDATIAYKLSSRMAHIRQLAMAGNPFQHVNAHSTTMATKRFPVSGTRTADNKNPVAVGAQNTAAEGSLDGSPAHAAKIVPAHEDLETVTAGDHRHSNKQAECIDTGGSQKQAFQMSTRAPKGHRHHVSKHGRQTTTATRRGGSTKTCAKPDERRPGWDSSIASMKVAVHITNVRNRKELRCPHIACRTQQGAIPQSSASPWQRTRLLPRVKLQDEWSNSSEPAAHRLDQCRQGGQKVPAHIGVLSQGSQICRQRFQDPIDKRCLGYRSSGVPAVQGDPDKVTNCVSQHERSANGHEPAIAAQGASTLQGSVQSGIPGSLFKKYSRFVRRSKHTASLVPTDSYNTDLERNPDRESALNEGNLKASQCTIDLRSVDGILQPPASAPDILTISTPRPESMGSAQCQTKQMQEARSSNACGHERLMSGPHPLQAGHLRAENGSSGEHLIASQSRDQSTSSQKAPNPARGVSREDYGQCCRDSSTRADDTQLLDQCSESIALERASDLARLPGSNHARSGSLLHEEPNAGSPTWERVLPPSSLNGQALMLQTVPGDIAKDQDVPSRNTVVLCLAPSSCSDVRVQAEQLDEDSTVLQTVASRPHSCHTQFLPAAPEALASSSPLSVDGTLHERQHICLGPLQTDSSSNESDSLDQSKLYPGAECGQTHPHYGTVPAFEETAQGKTAQGKTLAKAVECQHVGRELLEHMAHQGNVVISDSNHEVNQGSLLCGFVSDMHNDTRYFRAREHDSDLSEEYSDDTHNDGSTVCE
jgi:hypothetical protein